MNNLAHNFPNSDKLARVPAPSMGDAPPQQGAAPSARPQDVPHSSESRDPDSYRDAGRSVRVLIFEIIRVSKAHFGYHPLRISLIALATAALLGGCAGVRAVVPGPGGGMTAKESRSALRHEARPASMPPADGAQWPESPAGAAARNHPTESRPLTLEMCRAMALQHNIEIQAESWEESAWDATRKAGLARVFPRLVGSGEWTDHGKGLMAYAGSDADGSPGVVEGFSGRGRTSLSYFGEIRWSPNDAGAAFLATNIGANGRAKAALSRAGAVQKTLGAVEAAFYRLLSLDQCLHSVGKLVELRAAVAQRSRDLRRKRLAEPDEAGRAEQKAAAARLLEARVSSELERQRTLLAVRLGVSPRSPQGRGICVAGPLPRPVPEALAKLVERVPGTQRPDVCAEALNIANASAEVTKNTLKLLPKVTGYLRASNERRGRKKHYANKRDAGVLVYLDATEWFAGLHERDAAQARRERATARFRAVSLNAEAEVGLAYMKCIEGIKDLQTMELAVARSRELVASARERAKAGELEPAAVDEAQANELQDDIERMRMLGEVNARFAELGAAAGTHYAGAADCGPECAYPRAPQ